MNEYNQLINQTINSLKKNGVSITLRKIYLYVYVYIVEKKLRKTTKFLEEIKGVIHVGANEGQERFLYSKYDLNVLWFEPISKIYEQLNKNIEKYPKQKAHNMLITEDTGKFYEFNISNGDGASSSLFEFAGHSKIWPSVHYEYKLKMEGISLFDFFKQKKEDINNYQALVMDVQGAELMVLKGAGKLLSNLKYIKLEAADFELYKNGCLIDEIKKYLTYYNFHEVKRVKFAEYYRVGSCFNILFKKNI